MSRWRRAVLGWPLAALLCSGLAAARLNPSPALLNSEPLQAPLVLPAVPAAPPSAQLASPAAAPIVVIDPGHGGWDTGTISPQTGLTEKSVTLAISLDLAQLLRAAGLRVRLFRSQDTAHAPPGNVLLNLQRQVELARPPYSLFVGIYVNSCPHHLCPGVVGPHTYDLGGPVSPALLLPQAGTLALAQALSARNAALSEVLAADLQLAASLRTGWPDNGVSPAPFYVLRFARIPAALIEVGYMTDLAEAQQMALPAWQWRIARGLAQGILADLAQPEEASQPRPLPAQAASLGPEPPPGLSRTQAALAPPPRLQLSTSPLPAVTVPGAASAPEGTSSSLVPYVVRLGDTLYHLALETGSSVAALMVLNDLASPKIRVGQHLLLPAEPVAPPALP